MTVLCRWNRLGCGWGVRRETEKDAWNALYEHLDRAHGHNVYAQKGRPS